VWKKSIDIPKLMDLLRKVFVQGGEVVVTDAPTELVTILGSCVAVCLWDRVTKTGGMNHYLLPSSRNGENNANVGSVATKMLIESVCKTSNIKNLEASIFGGGNKFFSDNFLVVGPQNVEAAKTALAYARIPVVLEDTGGNAGRKVYFDTSTGSVKVTIIN
jgi:chemotaxis protein CheD